jgi:hypothetical protein
MTCYKLHCPVDGVSVSAPLLEGGAFIQLGNLPDSVIVANTALRADWQVLAAMILVIDRKTGQEKCGVAWEETTDLPAAAPVVAAPEKVALPVDTVKTFVETDEKVDAPVAPAADPVPAKVEAPVAKTAAKVKPAKEAAPKAE